MRNFKTLAVRLAAIPAFVLASGAAMAADTPTTAAALAQAVDLSDAKSAGLIIVGTLVALGVTLWGGRLLLAKFNPKV